MADHARQLILWQATDGTDNGITAAGTQYTTTISLPKQATLAIHLEWDVITCTDTFWASDKPDPREDSDTDWVQAAPIGITISSPAGSASKVRYDIDAVGARWFRMKSVYVSGSGKRRGWATIKEG